MKYSDGFFQNLRCISPNQPRRSTRDINELIKMYELERTRMCYGNSPIGREQIVNDLPEQYANAVLAVWGETPTLSDPEKGGE